MIISPGDGTAVTEGQAVEFHGQAVNVETRIPIEHLAWTSSINGPLGASATIVTRNLAEGTHEITLMADGSSERASITLHVRPRPGPG
jgi:hypothetical protein